MLTCNPTRDRLIGRRCLSLSKLLWFFVYLKFHLVKHVLRERGSLALGSGLHDESDLKKGEEDEKKVEEEEEVGMAPEPDGEWKALSSMCGAGCEGLFGDADAGRTHQVQQPPAPRCGREVEVASVVVEASADNTLEYERELHRQQILLLQRAHTAQMAQVALAWSQTRDFVGTLQKKIDQGHGSMRMLASGTPYESMVAGMLAEGVPSIPPELASVFSQSVKLPEIQLSSEV